MCGREPDRFSTWRGRICIGLVIWTLAIITRVENSAAAVSDNNALDVTNDRVTFIAPGTRVGKDSPAGWSHLILKSQPRVAAGDIGHFSNEDKELASLFRTVLVANVIADNALHDIRFRLEKIGVGVCMPIGDEREKQQLDTVVTPDSQKKLGANLGFLARSVLSKVHDEQRAVRYVCRSDNEAVFDYPVIMRWKEKNRRMFLRYAVLVNEQSGQLNSLVWLIETDQKEKHARAVSSIQCLQPNKCVSCPLYVDTNEYTFFGIPTKRAFAVNAMPHGSSQTKVPLTMEQIFAQETVAVSEARLLLGTLREVLESGALRVGRAGPQPALGAGL